MYELWIGGGSPDSDPMYIYLALADDLDTRIDIRDGGVTEFIGADHSEVLLAKAINEAILAENKPSKPDGLYHCASFVLLDQQELSGTPQLVPPTTSSWSLSTDWRFIRIWLFRWNLSRCCRQSYRCCHHL